MKHLSMLPVAVLESQIHQYARLASNAEMQWKGGEGVRVRVSEYM